MSIYILKVNYLIYSDTKWAISDPKCGNEFYYQISYIKYRFFSLYDFFIYKWFFENTPLQSFYLRISFKIKKFKKYVSNLCEIIYDLLFYDVSNIWVSYDFCLLSI
jgi:hypothetical protein